MEYLLGMIILVLIGVISYQSKLYAASVKDLTLKLMAKNVSDYVFLTNREMEEANPVQTPQSSVPVMEEMMDLSDSNLSDEDLLNALKK